MNDCIRCLSLASSPAKPRNCLRDSALPSFRGLGVLDPHDKPPPLAVVESDIAAAAKISKQTIYTHFTNKEELFADLVLGNAGRVDEFVAAMTGTLKSASDLESGLRELARLYIRFLVRPEVLRLRRLVIAEAGRFPELARTYYERVPAKVYAALAGLFRELANDGRLRLEDASLAAYHFAWLTIGMPLDRGMFFEPEANVIPDVDGLADAAVRVFLSAYAPRS